ncbi:CYP3A4 [Cordylochernes scorpioides]|uniref:CYP3A4 n=1 Tax=Cordylochernes scorpioides TaxID=51811 RepID=A0ABY6KL99_9ARAC|nr:CYP3A4 [Cordylochernes scorpioides]
MDTSKDILTDVEISSNAVNFIFAGYETSKLLMSYTTHMLIHHPDIQDKVREEILTVVGDKKEISYDDLKEFHLMDRVLSETLRLHPPTLTGGDYEMKRKGVCSSITRASDEDFEVLGKTIPKEVGVMVPLGVLHLSSKYWKEPLVFDPDRFSPDQKVDPLVYMPFGAGPRFCIGKKMALTVTKLALARLLRRYRVLPGPHTDKVSAVRARGPRCCGPRFSPDQKVDPLVYMPFGAGPRFCIGKKIALR